MILPEIRLLVAGDEDLLVVLVGVACSLSLLALHPSVYTVLPLALNAGLAWVAWTSAWTPSVAWRNSGGDRASLRVRKAFG